MKKLITHFRITGVIYTVIALVLLTVSSMLLHEIHGVKFPENNNKVLTVILPSNGSLSFHLSQTTSGIQRHTNKDLTVNLDNPAQSLCPDSSEFQIHKTISIAGLELAVVEIVAAICCIAANEEIGRSLFKYWILVNFILIICVLACLILSLCFGTCISKHSISNAWVAFCIICSFNAGTIIALSSYLWFVLETTPTEKTKPALIISEVNLFRQYRARKNNRSSNIYI